MKMTAVVRRSLFALGLVATLAPELTIHAQRPETPSLILESVTGRDSFELYCASCHGTTGKGDGPIVAALKARPADLTTLALRNNGAFPRERVLGILAGTSRAVLAHGPTDMPVWGPIFRGLDPSEPRVRQRIDNVVAHIEGLQVDSTGPDDLGSRLFRTHCATCHGSNARGNGPLSGQLRQTPPDLTKYTARNGGVFPSERVYRIIDGRDIASHGDREMPVWGDAFRSTRDGLTEGSAKMRIDAIVRYLRGIQERAAE